MKYSKFQRTLSSFILFFFFFSMIFQMPFPGLGIYAENKGIKNLVSIIVEEELYDAMKGSLNIYAKNISQTLENTQVLILPTPSDASPLEIASLNESLYFEGLYGLQKGTRDAKLVGTVLVGDFDLPVVYKEEKAEKTIIPYVDFEDKFFIYNHKNKQYENSQSNRDGLKADIWHGVISPNSGDKEKDLQLLKGYFTKNNHFYKGTGIFSAEKGIINGNADDVVSDIYEPYVFYFDQIRESKAMSHENYEAYKTYAENKEDIIYKRYNQELADKIQDQVRGGQKEFLDDVSHVLGDAIDVAELSKGPGLTNIPDIQTRHVINKTIKKFFEIYSKGSIGKLRKFVHNAGRYNESGNHVNVDFIPYLITVLDEVNDKIILDANTDIEGRIDGLITGGLSRKIAIPSNYVQKVEYSDEWIEVTKNELESPECPFGAEEEVGSDGITYCVTKEDKSYKSSYGDHYKNFYYGKVVRGPNSVKNAMDCSLYRGSRTASGTLVEANRSYNVERIQDDLNTIKFYPGAGDITGEDCLETLGESGSGLNGWFGKNTGLFLDSVKSKKGKLTLREGANKKGALVPLFDIKGSVNVNKDEDAKSSSYLQCLENNYYLDKVNRFIPNDDYEKGTFGQGKVIVDYRIPLNGSSPINWTCKTSNRKAGHIYETYDSLYLDGNCRIEEKCQTGNRDIYFKTIESLYEHKSPTAEEIGLEIASGITPALPIDRNRYADFMANTFDYAKIDYAYLFRTASGKSIEETKENIKKTLDQKSDEINQIIRDTDGEYPRIEAEIRAKFGSGMTLTKNSIQDELKFKEIVEEKEAEILDISGSGAAGVTGSSNGKIEDNYTEVSNKITNVLLKINELTTERDLFVDKKSELEGRIIELKNILSTYDVLDTGGKHCISGDCSAGWMSSTDRTSLIYEVELLDKLIIDYQKYIDQLALILYKLDVQKSEMSLLSSKLQLQVENLSQIWSSLEYDKNAINPIYEELNQRIQELNEAEKSFEITDKVDEIKERITYLFSAIDTLDIKDEETALLRLNANINTKNDLIIQTIGDQSSGILTEYQNKILAIESIIVSEKSLSVKKRTLAQNISIIGSGCKENDEGKVDTEKCKQVHESIEEYKLTPAYLNQVTEIANLNTLINASTESLYTGNILGTTENIETIIDDIESEISILGSIKEDFDIDILNVNNNIDSINSGIDLSASDIENTNNLLKDDVDKIEKVNDEIDDLGDLIQEKIDEIQIIHLNIQSIMNTGETYLLSNTIDDNPYDEVFSVRNNLWIQRDDLESKQSDLNLLETNTLSKQVILESEINSLLLHKSDLEAFLHEYSTKETDKKWYKCEGSVCNSWITEVTHTAITQELIDLDAIILEYQDHALDIDELLTLLSTNKIEITTLLSEVLAEIGAIDRYILSMRKDDIEYRQSLLGPIETNLITQRDVIQEHLNHVNTITGILTPFSELVDTEGDFINEYGFDAVNDAFSGALLDSTNYFHNGEVSQKMTVTGTDVNGDPIFSFLYDYYSRSTVMGKLTRLDEVKIIAEERLLFLNTQITEITDKLSEKSDEVLQIDSLISEITEGNNDESTTRASLDTLVSDITNVLGKDNDVRIDFDTEKIDVLNSYGDDITLFVTLIDNFFTSKLGSVPVISPIVNPENIPRYGVYINTGIDYTSERNNILTTQLQVESRITTIENQFGIIDTRIDSIGDSSDELGEIYYIPLVLSIDSINFGLLSNINFIYNKIDNEILERQATLIVDKNITIGLLLDSTDLGTNPVLHMSNLLWTSLTGIEDYNKDDILEYNKNELQETVDDIDNIEADNFYGRATESERIGIVGDAGTGGQLDKDSNILYLTIEECIRLLRKVELYHMFKTSEFHPKDNVDLYKTLLENEKKTLTIGEDTKELEYIDSLAFAIYWESMTSVSEKYKFIIEHYLSDEFQNNDDKFHLPKNKKQYEIAYLGAQGDTQNMHIQMNPEKKEESPYLDILKKNAELQAQLLGENISGTSGKPKSEGSENNNGSSSGSDSDKKSEDGENEENNEGEEEKTSAVFKCAPPEGVPIYEWMPAITCWLDDMLPPKISVSDSSCGPTLDLLSEEDRDYIEQCDGDTDKNNINDCVEKKLEGGSLKMRTESQVYNFDSPGNISVSVLDSQNNGVSFDSSSEVQFTLVKIETGKDATQPFGPNNIQVVYDLSDPDLSDKSIISDYLNYEDRKIKVQGGVAELQFTSQNVEANFYFETKIETKDQHGEVQISIGSDVMKVEVRGDQLFATTYTIEKNEIDNEVSEEIGLENILANDVTQIYLFDLNKTNSEKLSKTIFEKSSLSTISLVGLENLSKSGEKLPISYPVKINVFDDEGKSIFHEYTLYSDDIKPYFEIPAIRESGFYTLDIVDSKGYKVKKSLEVSPNSPDHFKIDLGANMLQTGGAVSSNVVTILDKFDNPVIGTTYTVDINVSGNGLVFQNSGETSSSTQVIEGYKIFRLMTTDTKGKHSVDITLKDLGGNILLEEHSEIEVISDVNVHIIENNNLEVGGETYTLRVEVLDDEGEINNEINSRLYFTVADIYGKTTRDYFPVIQGVAHVQVETSKLANPEIPVEIQIEGMSEIFNDTISILHGNPRYLQLAMNNSSMEAKEGNVQELKIFIKDQFGNITYSYNDDSFDLELDEKYQKYISIDNESAKIEEGVGTINIEASNRPGLSHFKVTVGELVTAGQIETFYYLNEKTTKNFTYNALYTTLLGAAYGDYTQKGYLAGGLLFDSKNRSLAVTSLLNNPYKQNDVVMVHTEGGVNSIASASDLSTDISFEPLIENKKLQISVSNLAMGGYIGKIIPHIGKEKAELILCDGNSGDISDCNVSEETTSILLQSKSLDYNAYSKDDILYIQDKYGKKLFSIDKFGTIERFGNISFELSRNNTQNHLQLELFTGVNKIGELFYNFVDADIRTTRRTVNDALYNNLDNTIIVYLHAENYTNRDMYTQGGVNKIISYNSPFDTKYQLNEFHSSDTSGYENFQKNEGIGWKEGNKTLLSFAAGDSVGKSVQLYQSFSVINLGDPVLQLKKIQKTLPKDDTQLRNFDATIGKLLYENEKLKSYEVFDYNNDGKKDIILIHRDNYLELLEKSDGTKQFYPRGNVAHIYDLGDTNNIKAGNFRGDGYDDIFFVNDQGNPFLLNNNKKDFTRIDLTEQFSLSGSIVRTEMYDMDYDGLDDIIILDDTGTVSIHYGVLGNVSPLSEKVSLGMTGMPEINSEPRTDRGALYFNGLVSLGKTGDNSKLLEDSKAFSEAVQNNAADVVVSDANISSADSLDGLVFVQIPYSSKNNTDKTQAERLVSGIKTPLSKDIGAEIIKARKEISGFVDKYPDNIIYPETYPEVSQSDFIRSEYAGQVGIDIQKVYEGKVKGGSIVNFTLNITNNTDDVLKNIAYVETVLPVFALDETSIKTNKKTVVSFDTPGYEFLIDNFELEPGETLELTAQLKMVPIKFGYLRVGLFENGEVGDDKYGDVIVTPSHENCGETVELFRSCEVDSDNNGIDDCNENGNKPRVYRFGTKTPKCNAENIRLPDELVQNVEDLDQNGIPDYIDILQTGTQEEQAAYTQTLRESIADDVDGDGLPDIEDSIRSDGKTISNLEEINKNADLLVDGIDNLIQGLSCGFGGGGCIATPMNWAPLAPGGDPTLFGVPTGDGMNIDEGLPVFSALTWMPIYVPACFPIPVAWPISSSQMTSACAKNVFGMDGAGGYLGTDSPSNFFRLFVTPTLTGGVGIAACFGSTASVAGYANMPGISPLLPGGNCVVVAKPLSSCENDGSDGDPGSIGFPSASSGGGRGSSNNTNGNNGGNSSGNGGGNSQTNSQGDQVSFQGFSILNANCSPGKGTNATLTPELVQEYLNYKNTGIESATFKDVFKHSLGSTGGARKGSQNPNMNEPLIEFNGQSMDDEISANIDFSTGKEGDYTDVIKVENRRISPFPDFLMEWVTKQIEEIVTKLTDFPTVFIILPNFDGILDYGSSEYDNPKKEVNSGIEEAYKFLSSLPLISIEQETLSIELPWIEEAERKAAVQKWSNTVDQWKKEVKRAGESWSLGATCKEGDTVCEENNAASAKILVDAEALISSLERNIEVLEDYREFPKKVGELVRKKEDYLEQILCNVESISEILGGWIGLNGERFNAWVELYILIKAILKSWQGLIDVFVDYEAECHECKNERGDLQTFIWKLISVVIPEIPVIQFPKWPDIILDLHHIRAGLVITLPEFTFGTRPIILPNLPNLYLPDAPNVNIVLPSLPVLPTIDLPELPDLPVLPTVELPNLPPPPTLPKMFASLEEVLEILKVITKAMCILKTSPFTPEWKAGDQIAFLTERQGYLDMDFIDLSLPQYSYSHVDAIKVTSYVNLEFETEFVTELARQITMPLTTFTNDFSTILNIGVDDLDFTLLPTDIDIHLDGNVEVGSHQQDQIMQFAMYMAKGVGKAAGFMEMNKDVTVSNSEFKLLVAEALSSDVFISHPKYNEFRNIWDPVFAYNFEREEKIISDLQKNNFEKFETLKNILHTEILQNRELLKNLDQELQPDFMKKVVGEGGDDIEIYNKELAVYNKKFIDSAHDLMYGNGNEMQNDLAQRGDDLLDRVQSPLKRYQDAQKHISMNGGTQKPKHPIAASACQEQAESEYKFNYEGLYTIENRGGKDHSYRLFDYLNELDGKEEITQIDVDGDGDDDILYKVGDELYLKENLNFEPIRIHDDVKIITPEVNKFYDEDIDYTAVDGLREGFVDNDYLNAIFSASTREDISSYRLEFSGLVDRTTDRVSLVDTFADIENITYIDDGELFIARKNLSYITNAGILKNIEMTTKPFRNIKDDIRDGKVVDISSDTTIYADSGKVRLTYMKKGSTEEKIITIPAYQNLHVKRSIKIIGIHGDAYIAGPYDTTLRGEEIRSYIGMPLLPGSHIRHTGNNIPDKFSFVDIEYYDNGSNRFRWDKIKEYWLYDIGAKAEKYSITLNTENDYLYANIRSFKENLFSTYSKQIVLAPQTVADNYAPEFYLESIKIPVYQKQNIDLTDFIFDEGGIKGLKKIEIDMDLQKDSNGDGDTKNDSDIPESNIKKTLIQLGIEIGPFDTLRNDSIGISFTDSNNNKGFFEIPFEVYAPVPEIDRLNTQGFIGEINEKLDNEPISLFRYRGGKITQIEDETGEDTVLTQSGSYNFKVNEESQGLTLEYQGSKIADISEKTGKISLLDYFSSIRMYPSSHPKNNDFYPTIQILKDSKVIYYQYLNISNVTSVTPVESFDTIADPGIYVQFSNSEIYGFYNIPETVTYNPGAVIIHKLQDTQKTPLFILYPDGRIETLNDFYKLEYDTYNEFISVKLINKNSNTEVAKVLFYIDGGYIMR